MKFEEKIRHGSVRFPYSLHETIVPENTEKALYLHCHKEMELFYLLEGEVLFCIENREYSMSVGDAVFINSGLLHYAISSNTKGCRFFAFVFHPSAITDNPNSSLYQEYLIPVESGASIITEYLSPPKLPWTEPVIKTLNQLYTLYGKSPHSYELLIKSYLLEIWHHLFSNTDIHASKDDRLQWQLTPVYEYIHANYSEKISIKELAELASLSVSQFCRVFKTHSGMTSFTYLTHHRIIQATLLLQSTDWKISYIAAETGFENLSYFNRAFQHFVGCSPSEYRKVMV